MRAIVAIGLLTFTLSWVPSLFAQTRCGGGGAGRACESWLLESPGWLRGEESVRFGGQLFIVANLATIKLDSAIISRSDGVTDWITVDSIITPIEATETLVSSCGPSLDSLTGYVVGIVRDTVDRDGLFPRPRLAWLLDTISLRIQPVVAAPVICMSEYAGDD